MRADFGSGKLYRVKLAVIIKGLLWDPSLLPQHFKKLSEFMKYNVYFDWQFMNLPSFLFVWVGLKSLSSFGFKLKSFERSLKTHYFEVLLSVRWILFVPPFIFRSCLHLATVVLDSNVTSVHKYCINRVIWIKIIHLQRASRLFFSEA